MTDNSRLMIARAKDALRQGHRTLAFELAQKAVSLDPNLVEGWLILGGLSDPQNSLGYLQTAKRIAPENPRVNQAYSWVTQELAKQGLDSTLEPTQAIPRKLLSDTPPIPPLIVVQTHRPVWLWTFITLFVLAVFFFGLELIPSQFVRAKGNVAPIQQNDLVKPSLTSTNTFTPTVTHTSTQTPTSTPTHTPTSTYTHTPTATSTPTLIPSDTPIPVLVDEDLEGRWIDIDLSDQRLYAYDGNTIVRSFLVSTGTWQYPTPVGRFAVYIKLRYTDMAGPGYYLPDVPYTMYFYEGYGIHGTYWHDNFGTPMSHGCVNMRTEEAGWLFDWSYVGIIVNIHE